MAWLKYIIAGIVVFAAGWLLIQPKRESRPVPTDRVIVRYWEKWTGKEGQQMNQIVDWFNETVGKEKGIFVQYISMSQIDQKTLVSTAAGLPPDIAGLWDTQTTQFAAMDALEPLGEMAKAKGLTRELYKPVYWDACTYEGELWAFPSTPAVIALHYNKRLIRARTEQLRAAGFDPEKLPTTIDELDRYAACLDVWTGEPKNGGSLKVVGHMPQEPGWWMPQTPTWFGATLFDRETKQLRLTSPESVAAFEWIGGYSKRLGVTEMRNFRAGSPQGFDSPQSPFFSGTITMLLQGPWLANYINIHNPKMSNAAGLSPADLAKLTREERRQNCDWGVAPFPSAVPGVKDACLTSMDTLVIPRTSKHKKEAFEFVAFVQRQDVMERLVSMHCKNSPLKAVSAGYIANHPNPYIEVFEALAASPNARTIPSLPVWPEVGAELGTAAEKVYLQQATPLEALEVAQKRAQLAVDRHYQRRALRQDVSAAASTGNEGRP